MTMSADNVRCYTYGDRELVAVPLGHKHYLVLHQAGAACCVVRRFEYGELRLHGEGSVSLHRVKHLASLVQREADTGVEALIRGVIDVHWDARPKLKTEAKPGARRTPRQIPRPKLDPLRASQELMDKLRCHESFTASVESALRLAIANAHTDAAAYAYAHGMERAFNEFGLKGVQTNTAYLVNNLKRWSSDSATEAKNTLMKWAR